MSAKGPPTDHRPICTFCARSTTKTLLLGSRDIHKHPGSIRFQSESLRMAGKVDTSSGRVVADLRIDKDADDVFYDAKRQRVYVSCGEGFLDVFQQVDADHYTHVARIPTAPGARSSLWVPQMNRLFVAVPHRDSQRAEIRIFDAP